MATSLFCPNCKADWNGQDRYCPNCGNALHTTTVPRSVVDRTDEELDAPRTPYRFGDRQRGREPDTSPPWSASWALIVGVAAAGLTLVMMLILRVRKPDQLYTSDGAVHGAYDDEWEACQALGDLSRRVDCWDELKASIATSQEWYLTNYIWVSLGVGVIVTVVALLMIIASNAGRGP